MRYLVIAAIAASGGCLRATQFQCSTDADCGANGKCEQPVRFCAFPDDSCGGYRFGDSAGAYSNQCTSSSMPPDGGGSGSGSGSGQGNCPSGYNVIGTLPHLYKLITGAQDWKTQVTACAATSSTAYLMIPDDATELMATDALSTQYWIGIHNTSEDEPHYTTVKGNDPTYTPWANGEPNQGDPPQDCVDARAAQHQIGTDRCGTKFPAVCECEP